MIIMMLSMITTRTGIMDLGTTERVCPEAEFQSRGNCKLASSDWAGKELTEA
jgi:hypothetical protein